MAKLAVFSDLLDRLGNWYNDLAEQEQRILLYGAPLIIFLVIYLILLQPLGSAYFSRQAELQERREALSWVGEQRQMLERLNTSCDLRSQIFSAESLQSDLDAAARRFGIVPVIRAMGGQGGFQMQIDSAEGNRILNLVRVLACGGAKVTALEMQKLGAESSSLSATITIAATGA
jgi:type II secretory pathway component PulM